MSVLPEHPHLVQARGGPRSCSSRPALVREIEARNASIPEQVLQFLRFRVNLNIARAARMLHDVCAAPTRPALVADLGPATVQAADSGPARRYRYQPVSAASDPLPPPPTAKPRVLITLGTYPNADAAPLIRATVDAALDTGADVIAVLGNEDRGLPKTLPPNATVLDWVDMPTAKHRRTSARTDPAPGPRAKARRSRDPG